MYDGGELSTVDGFMEVRECVAEMIKYVANEPSVGLYYIQQHTHTAIPNLLHLKDRVVDRSRETTLHTEDSEDSIVMVRSMKDCGVCIVDEMLKDIKKSLVFMSTSQPKSGLTHNWSSGFQMGKSSSWGPTVFGQNSDLIQQDGESSGSYLSTVFNSAKQKAVSIRWPQLDTKQSGESQVPSPNAPSLAGAVASAVSILPSTQVEELPLSSQTVDEQLEESPVHDLSSASQNFEEFKASRAAKLEEWLEERENLTECKERNSLNS